MNQIVKQNKHLLSKLMVLLSLVLCTLFSWSIISRAAEKTLQDTADYTAKVIEESSSNCKIVFTQKSEMKTVIIHYTVNNGDQQNLNMERNGSDWTYNIQNIANNDSIQISFTYITNGDVGHDSETATHVMGSAGGNDNSGNNDNNNSDKEETPSNIRIEAESYTKMSGIDNNGGEISGLDTNDWMRYQTEVKDAGKYHIVVRGKANGTANGVIVFRDAQKRIATITINKESGDMAEYRSEEIELAAGALELTAITVSGGITADWIELQPVKEDNSGNNGDNNNGDNNSDNNSGNNGDNTGNPNDPTPPENLTSTTTPEIDESIPAKQDKMIFQFNNLTNGAYRDDQIYWCILGIDPNTNKLCYVDAEGNTHPATAALNTIKKNDRMCADICNTVAENKHVYMPSIISGRMYISYGEQVYITINEDANGNVGFAGPDLKNTSDPNREIYFEFLEFTIGGGHGKTEYWGNTTRVDNFCFPIVTRLVGETINLTGEYEHYDRTVGDVGSRAYLFNEFKNSAPDIFKNLADDYRIVAPCKGSFNEGEANANYLQGTIDAFWDKYSKEDLKFECQGGDFVARASGDKITFTETRSGETGTVQKPNTQEVLEGKGAFDRGTPMELVFEAQLCAAFNRGVALNPADWYNPDKYYPDNVPCNYYSKYWHDHSVNKLAYGFCYDDVHEQATLLYCTKAETLAIDLKW